MSEKEEKKIQNKSMKKSRSLSRSPSLSSLSLSSNEKKIIPRTTRTTRKGTTRKRRNRKIKNKSAKRNNNKPVKLLGNSELFQVSFNEEQLQKYTPITNVHSSASSFINTCILLGLMYENEAKKELRSIDKQDIFFKQSRKILEKNFDLPENTLKIDVIPNSNWKCPDDDVDSCKDQGGSKLNEKLNKELELNHATIIILSILDTRNFPVSETLFFYLIAYKKKIKGGKNVITYFDPIKKRYFENINDIYGDEVLGEKYRSRRNMHNFIDLDTVLKYRIKDIAFFTINDHTNGNDIFVQSKMNNVEYKVPDNITKYAMDHFSDPIKVLGRHSLMQVTFTQKQFDEYQDFNYRGSMEFGGGACVIHSLFSLGLRHVKKAKLEGEIMHMKKQSEVRDGVPNIYTSKYLTKILKLPKGSIKVHAKHFIEIPEYEKQYEDEMSKILDTLLENNYATIISVVFVDTDDSSSIKLNQQNLLNYYMNKDPKFINDMRLGFYGNISGHAIVAYKMNDKVGYYDPQTLSNSSSVSEVMKKYADPFLIRSFKTYHIDNFEQQDDIILDNASCNIDLDISDKSDDSSYTKVRKNYGYHIDMDGREGRDIILKLQYENRMEWVKKRIQTLEGSAPITPEEMEELERLRIELEKLTKILKKLKELK
tara:strand:+ start:1431 stop:3389 length:1959 start_codon:yes stop_codon:yes gene_type:complete